MLTRLYILLITLFSVYTTCVSAWSVTQYVVTTTNSGDSDLTFFPVTPTGPVSPTSTSISTTTATETAIGFYEHATLSWVVTMTYLYVDADASVCTGSLQCPRTTRQVSADISTRYFVPLVIQNPSSCTKTSFSYTSSSQVYPDLLTKFGLDILSQATDSAHATLATTNTFSLGGTGYDGSPRTTSFYDVYFKPGVVDGIEVDVELIYLDQCVDPSSFLCTTTMSMTGCMPGVSITYPPSIPPISASTPAATTTPITTTTTEGGAEKLWGKVNQWAVLGAAVLAILSPPFL